MTNGVPADAMKMVSGLNTSLDTRRHAGCRL